MKLAEHKDRVQRPGWRVALSKATFAVADQGLLSGANFVIAVLLARWMDAEQYGAYALAYSILLFASSFHNSLLLEPMSVFGPSRYEANLSQYVRKQWILHAGVSLAAAASLATVAFVLHVGTEHRIIAGGLLGAACGLPFILGMWLARRSAYLELRADRAATAAGIYAALSLAAVYALRAIDTLSAATAFIAQGFSGLVAIIAVWVWSRPTSQPTSDISAATLLRENWSYGKWVAASAVGYWLSGGAYYIVVAAVLSISDVAALRALQNLIQPWSQLLTALGLLLLPWASRAFAKHGLHELRGSLRKAVVAFSLGAVGYAVLAYVFRHELLHLLYGPKYDAAAPYIFLLVLPLPLMAAAQALALGLRAMRRPRDIFVAYTASGVATIVLGVAFTGLIGIAGALVGLAISGAVFFVVLAKMYLSALRSSAVESVYRPAEATADVDAPRITVLMPSLARGYYWHPIFAALTSRAPQTVVFTGYWPGFLEGFHNSFRVELMRGKRLSLARETENYKRDMVLFSPTVLLRIARTRPDVILTNQFGVLTAYALFLRWLKGTRVVLLWEGVAPGIAYLQSSWRLRLRRALARHFDLCLTNSRAGADYLRDVIEIPAAKILQQPYEVPEPSIFTTDAAHVASTEMKRPMFLYVGSLSDRKGMSYLLEAATRLANHGCDFSLVLAGSGPREQELRTIVHERGLSKKVRFAGQVAYRDLGRWFRACDVFLLPSLEDTWGMVTLEAMTFGRAVMGSSRAGSSELIEHGVNGFIFDPVNVEQLEQLMKAFIDRPELAREFGERSSAIIGNHTPQRAAELLLRVSISAMRREPPEQKLAFDVVT